MPEAESAPQSAAGLEETFQIYEREIRVKNYRTCVWLTIIFMLAGSSLDWIVYGKSGAILFLPLRLISVAVLAGGWTLLLTPWGVRFHRVVGVAMALPMIVSISWMIAITDGAESPYYAGLNLVLLGAVVLMRWPLVDSIVVVIMTFACYLTACFMHGPIRNWSIFYNNLFFLVVTGALTTAGTWVYNRIRFSEFQSRHDLDINRKQLELANAKLEDNNRQLMELDEAKGRFFANISHELRTPLTLLIAPLDAMMNRLAPEARKERDTLAMMHANAMRLLKLINDLLDLVRLESGAVNVNAIPLNMVEFVESQAGAVRQTAESRQVSIDTSIDPGLTFVMVDEDKLERICLNLLFNAIKFTPPGGRVELSAWKRDEWLEVKVSDSGVGIAPDKAKHMFHRFWQADTSSQRKQRGLGIGLALVKELVEAHGGSVFAASESGKGTVMTVRLPLQIAAEASGASRIAAKAAVAEGDQWLADLYRQADLSPGKREIQPEVQPEIQPEVQMSVTPDQDDLPVLLIAEDEPDMRRFLKDELSESFHVLEAPDGRVAVEMALEHLPDIMLCDMMMPEKDGLQVCSEIRAHAEGRSIPIVMLTAKSSEQTKLSLLRAGASDFLAKPFSITEVGVRLRNLARTRRQMKLLAQQKQQLEQSMKQLKETEALLVRNEKLTSLGRLSAGLIHEINNPLHYAKQALYVLRRSAKSWPEEQRLGLKEIVDDVEGGIDRVAAIISDLRGFASRPNEEDLGFKLKPTVETALRFFSSAWKNGVGVDVAVSDDLELRGDRNHFLQVLINLVQNALDAVALKDYHAPDKPLINIRASREHDVALIKIRDNGPGIDPEIMNEIFDPFFTTKDVGEGMGLGLAITHRIIAEHRGSISVTSERGGFTEFTIELPLTDSASPITPTPAP